MQNDDTSPNGPLLQVI